MSTSTIAQRALDYALAQGGKRYVFGTAGPDTFDCSGLVVASFAHAGMVGLPHNAAQLRHRAKWLHHGQDKLKHGDLIFYYGIENPDHVGIFMGHMFGRGYVVQATDPAHGVEKISMYKYAQPASFGRL